MCSSARAAAVLGPLDRMDACGVASDDVGREHGRLQRSEREDHVEARNEQRDRQDDELDQCVPSSAPRLLVRVDPSTLTSSPRPQLSSSIACPLDDEPGRWPEDPPR